MIIGFSGPIGCGKSYAAAHMVNRHGFTLHKMAGPLKNMMRAVGLTEEHIEGKLKEVPCDFLCGKTPRHAMQTIGTEWGRDLIGADLWIRLWQHNMPDGNVVCDDIRFPNEAETIQSAGGLVVKINRAGCEPFDGHASETFYNVPCDIELNNDGDGFAEKLDKLLLVKAA